MALCPTFFFLVVPPRRQQSCFFYGVEVDPALVAKTEPTRVVTPCFNGKNLSQVLEVYVARRFDRLDKVELTVAVAFETSEYHIAHRKRAGTRFEGAQGIGYPRLQRRHCRQHLHRGTGRIRP